MGSIALFRTAVEYNHHLNYYNIKIEEPVKIDTYILQGESTSVLNNAYLTFQLEKTKRVWKEITGFNIEFNKIKVLKKKDWEIIESNRFGVGEIGDIVEELYEGNAVLLFVEDIEPSDCCGDFCDYSGITDSSERGAAIQFNNDYKVIMHELGHIFGLNHYLFEDNIMYKDGDVYTEDLTKPQVGKMKARIKKMNWDD